MSNSNLIFYFRFLHFIYYKMIVYFIIATNEQKVARRENIYGIGKDDIS